ncbi:MAG: sigma-70 family RNA polymerase sigma factor [Clostridiales bacterium]|nr:sigma-70 family RNA polymerase sigma factor [Clostridiales bacterium]
MTQEEFLAIFDQYRPMVYALALSCTRSPQDAEDVCQTAFLRLLERPPAQGKEKAWLAQVTVNECRSLLRAPWRKRRVELEEGVLESLSFEQPEEGALWTALGSLPPDQRALIHLRYYEGFTVAELAGQYRVPASVISARLYRAKKQLKKRLEGSDHGSISQNV